MRLEPNLAQAWPERIDRHRAGCLVARRVVHDLRNQLTGVLGYAELIKQTLPQSAPEWEFLKKMDTALRGATDLCNDLARWSDTKIVDSDTVDIGEIALLALEQVKSEWSAPIQFSFHGGDRLPLRGDKGRLLAAVKELLHNGALALSDGNGEVSLAVISLNADDLPAGVLDSTGQLCSIAVSDTGAGMEADVQQRACEAYFSTRRGRAGLGLFRVLGTALAHQGVLSLASDPGVGSTVTLILPLQAAS